MNNKVITFVILHYQSFETTIECIDYVKKIPVDGFKNIVVVDNASPNNTGKKIKEYFHLDESIYVLLSKSNLGFAKGNNLGYLYAKQRFDSDFIVVMNNDIMIKQQQFGNLLMNHLNDDVHIIAPDIITLEGNYQNPYRMSKISTFEILYILLLNTFNFIFYTIPILSKLLLFINSKRPRIRRINNESHGKVHYNIIPHGSCVIYTKKWILKEEFAFIPKTFMYLEEYLLYEYLTKMNYKTIYLPDIKVNHLEDIATNSIKTTKLQKAKFKAKHSTKSAKELLILRLFGIKINKGN